MNHDQDPSEESLSEPHKHAEPRHFTVKKAVPWLAVAIVVAAAIFATYNWQHKKVVSSNSQVQKANSQVQKLSIDNKSLSTKLSSAQSNFTDLVTKYNKDKAQLALNNSAKITTAIQDDLTLNIDEALYMNPDGTVSAGGSWVGIRMTLTNSTSSPISFSANNFQLEDSDSNFYQSFGYINASTFPAGWGSSTLQPQTLAPGQTIKGDTLFPMPNQNIKSFTLLNGAKAYQLTVQ